ncbi:DoxX family protein [Rhizobium bangladeshense]|uniref:DoxX family protein n=1 Tax=Rhizobium bangladeshense TaxID=1138189 RepID=A0ABS7LFC8_9HYPH|nr:DoxX family protein [Rhizobium bangladeshense]MBX4865786.1 DoxX family protein [Rhizobium bangladeshense]MBX4872326.1 DoxX family protein [Rhizobium bangladeshense]MBX4882367.1 DoxX family protein [Rhizobium bangladeshense]MBX4889001.1 DoxX family protein [Rhizobium bangladeshense]MBX4899468.1 DoxX family protein [Rhizobium bangladeshense]
MKTEVAPSHGFGAAAASLITRAESLLASVPQSLPLLGLRFALAVPFFRSGLTKWDGFLTLSSGAKYLFEQEFKLHIFGSAIAYPFPLTMAVAAGIGELILPILLILGLATRFAALGLLLMTAIIQLTIPEGWANFHLPWAAIALALVVFGGGRIAVDPFVMPRRK